MFTRPQDLGDDAIVEALTSRWGLKVHSFAYQPVGFGSHHWLARCRGQTDLFVTVDDLHKQQRRAADTTDVAFERLSAAFSTALAMHDSAGLDFVLPPVVAPDGGVIARLAERYSMVVHPYLRCRPTASPAGEWLSATDRDVVVDRLVQLHRATDAARPWSFCDDGGLPYRDELRSALSELVRPWIAGPYGEPARALLAIHASGVERMLAVYDKWVERILGDADRLVITHGEPHGGNVVVADDRYVFVDWESALIAPPERDLWGIDPGDDSIVQRYQAAGGAPVVPEALDFYRLWYDLFEVGGYLKLFRQPHAADADSAESWNNLKHFLRPAERWPALVG